MSLAPGTLSNEDLVERIASVAAAERIATAGLIALLAELEARKLHLAHGFKSLFGYCRHVLHCSEHEAYNRMEVVHAARRFPVILPMLADGLLHLTAVRLLAPRLRNQDHLALLGGAIHKSRREIVKMLACWYPSPDVPSTVRKLPAPPGAASEQKSSSGEAPTIRPQTAAANPAPSPSPVPARPQPAIAPLSAEHYRLQVTLDGEAHDDLRALQDLMRREIPTGDAAAIVARALKRLRREAEKKAFAATPCPRRARAAAPASRDIPAEIQRAVWRRDNGQCSFEGHSARCEERSFLEFHHLTPWIVGGQPSLTNIALRCRAHNQYEAASYFAPIRTAREVRAASP